MFGCIEAGHAQTQQGRGIGHGADDAVVATGHLAKARHLDTGRDGDEQLALKGSQLFNQCCQHAGHQLWLDCQHDHFGVSGRLGITLGDANAMFARQRLQLGQTGVGSSDLPGGITRLDQSGDDAAAHIARADKGQRSMLHQMLL